jgi:hypothetical protein
MKLKADAIDRFQDPDDVSILIGFDGIKSSTRESCSGVVHAHE